MNGSITTNGIFPPFEYTTDSGNVEGLAVGNVDEARPDGLPLGDIDTPPSFAVKGECVGASDRAGETVGVLLGCIVGVMLGCVCGEIVVVGLATSVGS